MSATTKSVYKIDCINSSAGKQTISLPDPKDDIDGLTLKSANVHFKIVGLNIQDGYQVDTITYDKKYPV